jgi:neurotransmitter-gated ion-channel
MDGTNSHPIGNARITATRKLGIIGMFFIAYLLLLPVMSAASQQHKEYNTPPDKDRPTTVYIGLYLLDIITLDQPKQMLRARYALSLHWKDPRTAFESTDNKPDIVIGDEVDERIKYMWWPDPQIVNQLSGITEINRRLLVHPDGDIYYSSVFVVDTATTLEFRKFPFDSQTIRIEFESFSFPKDELDYKVWGERTGVNVNIQNDEWILHDMSSTAGIRRLWESEDSDWSYVSFRLPIHRRTAYYVWRIIFPFCFFILISTCVYWMKRESLDRRVSIVVSFALTAVAFNFVVSGFFPNVSYLTILDAIILSGYLMCGITIISVISFELFKHHGKPEVWYYGNTAAKFMFPLLYILTWYLLYHIFMSHEDKFVYLIQHSQ